MSDGTELTQEIEQPSEPVEAIEVLDEVNQAVEEPAAHVEHTVDIKVSEDTQKEFEAAVNAVQVVDTPVVEAADRAEPAVEDSEEDPVSTEEAEEVESEDEQTSAETDEDAEGGEGAGSSGPSPIRGVSGVNGGRQETGDEFDTPGDLSKFVDGELQDGETTWEFDGDGTTATSTVYGEISQEAEIRETLEEGAGSSDDSGDSPSRTRTGVKENLTSLSEIEQQLPQSTSSDGNKRPDAKFTGGVRPPMTGGLDVDDDFGSGDTTGEADETPEAGGLINFTGIAIGAVSDQSGESDQGGSSDSSGHPGSESDYHGGKESSARQKGTKLNLPYHRARQTTKTDFGTKLKEGLDKTAYAVLAAGETAAPFIPGGVVVSAAVSGVGQLKDSMSGGSGDHDDTGHPGSDAGAESDSSSTSGENDSLVVTGIQDTVQEVQDELTGMVPLTKAEHDSSMNTIRDLGDEGSGSIEADETPGLGVGSITIGSVEAIPQEDPEPGEPTSTTDQLSDTDREFQVAAGAEVSDQVLPEGTLTDPNALIQYVLRESYLDQTQDLTFYAQKVKFFNECKKQVRDYLTNLRDLQTDYKDGEQLAIPITSTEVAEDGSQVEVEHNLTLTLKEIQTLLEVNIEPAESDENDTDDTIPSSSRESTTSTPPIFGTSYQEISTTSDDDEDDGKEAQDKPNATDTSAPPQTNTSYTT